MSSSLHYRFPSFFGQTQSVLIYFVLLMATYLIYERQHDRLVKGLRWRVRSLSMRLVLVSCGFHQLRRVLCGSVFSSYGNLKLNISKGLCGDFYDLK